MNTTQIRARFFAAAVVGAAPAMLFLGAGSAHAIQDVSDELVVPLVQDVSERAHGGILLEIPTSGDCANCRGFNPQPDPPGFPDPSSTVGILDPGSRVGIGGPDTRPPGGPVKTPTLG